MRASSVVAACGLMGWAGLAVAAPSAEPDWATVERQYRELPVEARQYVGPLFWLHGDETPAQLRGEIDRIAEVHPHRPTPSIASCPHSALVRRSTCPSQ